MGVSNRKFKLHTHKHINEHFPVLSVATILFHALEEDFARRPSVVDLLKMPHEPNRAQIDKNY